MPSAAYWAPIGTYGLRTVERATIEGFLRLDAEARKALHREAVPDDPGARHGNERSLLHPDLPRAPAGLLQAVTFTLTVEESDFLSQRIQVTAQGSLLAWLLAHKEPSEAGAIWEHHRFPHFPEELAEVVDIGRRFSCAIHGAPLLYNRLLAERRRSDSLVERYDKLLTEWAEELGQVRPFADWSPASLWSLLQRRRRLPAPPTITFANTWLQAVASQGVDACSDRSIRSLIREREIALKRGRARLVNDSALEAWRGDSGLVRLDYRWRVARRLINDVVTPSQSSSEAA
jgi:hypothetical protein